jgi:D-xylose transport system substrate-binding protein
MNGETPEATHSLYDTPSQLFTPAVVTAENIKELIFDAGIQTAAEICTGEYVEACGALGIQ